MVIRPFLICAALAVLAAGEAPPALTIPPSPSTAPGIRIWPKPAFSHWPAVAFADETRNIAISLPVRRAGVTGTIGWQGFAVLPFTLPTGAESISGLLPLPPVAGQPIQPGRLLAQVKLAEFDTDLQVTVAAVGSAWPQRALRNGFPVDADDVPVVLVDRRLDPTEKRRWSLLVSELPRPTGPVILVGDPLESLGANAWTGIEAERRPAPDQRYPHHAVLVALATLPDPLPRTVIWCPGNQAIIGGAWTEEEDRVVSALRNRFTALGARPRLVLALPPQPVEERLAERQRERREVLQRAAIAYDWDVVDLERAAGPAASANRVADGLFTTYPTGPALDRIRAALKDAAKP